MDAPTLQSLLTVAGATAFTVIIMSVLLPVLKLDPDVQDRFGPLLAIIVGIAVVEIATFTIVTGVGKQDVVQGAVTGIVAGLAAIGTHSVVKQTIVAKPKGT